MAGKRKFKTDHPDPIVRELESIREKLGVCQREMAESVDVPFRTYQKWVYADQKPRHGTTVLARARGMLPAKRANCWEVLNCGREPGGMNAHLDGPCPAATEHEGTGVNNGTNGGRVCWAIAETHCWAISGAHRLAASGTPCSLEVDAAKLLSCLTCDFFFLVLQEEGLANFKLLRPGQTYTQV